MERLKHLIDESVEDLFAEPKQQDRNHTLRYEFNLEVPGQTFVSQWNAPKETGKPEICQEKSLLRSLTKADPFEQQISKAVKIVSKLNKHLL
jgi:hypothetical protein